MGFALFRRPPDPPHLDVSHAGKRFRVALRRRNTARRITLRVSSATGDIVLTLPQRTDLDTARRFADAHGDWIATRIAKVPRRVRLAHGAKLPFRGVPHRIVHWSAIRGVTSATLDPYGDPVIAVTGEPAHVARRVREFLER
ncbi:MAG: YgjP-like metallopeptidase domain-containing protein, partial [Microvirga sp.]